MSNLNESEYSFIHLIPNKYHMANKYLCYQSLHRFNVGQGSQCCPIGLGRHVGPSAIPRKFPSCLLYTSDAADE